MAERISDYTREEFTTLVENIFEANRNGMSDEVLDELLDKFRALSEHPDGSDLIYWPEDESKCDPKGVVQAVQEWRAANGLPGFKE